MTSYRPTYMDLYDDYVTQKKSIRTIAEENQVSPCLITRNLELLNIPLRKMKSLPKITREMLRQDYTKNKMSITKIANKYGVSPPFIRRKLNRYKIKVRPPKSLLSTLTKETLYDLYIIQNLSINSISKKFYTASLSISKLLKKYDIPIKTNKKFHLSKEELYQEYIILNKPSSKIAKEQDVSQALIQQYIRRYNLYKPRKIVDGKILYWRKGGYVYTASYDEALNDYLNKSVPQIAKENDCHENSIRARLAELGILK